MDKTSKQPPNRAGRPSRVAMSDRLREAVRFLDDPIALQDSPLASLPAVRALTLSTFRGRTCASGLALRAVLREALATVARDLDGTVVADLAAASLRGATQASVAGQRGLREEWLSRRWKPVLLELVLERLLVASSQSGHEQAA
ncbi:MAG: hypothetical protein AB7N24_15370 [Dehalococcoidia bacterium]